MKDDRLKVLLVKPFHYFHKNDFIVNSTEPLGLISLATHIEDFCDVKVYDATVGKTAYLERSIYSKDLIRVGVDENEIKSELLAFNPDIVGVSAHFFSQSLAVKETIGNIRKTLPDVKIVVGGNYATCIKEDFLKLHPEIDILVYGEGEITFRQLCENNCENLDFILGIVYKNKEGVIIVNPPQPLIDDLKDLKIPNRKFIDSRLYHLINAPFFNELKIELHKIRFGRLVSWITRRNIAAIPKNRWLAALLSNRYVFKLYAKAAYFLTNKAYHPISADIEMSRGCPFHCVFCAVKNTWTRRFRSRPIEHVRKELTYLKHERKIEHINITDDVFNIDKDRLSELCDIFEELGIKSWRPLSGLYVMRLNRDILERMYNTGCKHICLIIESGCQKTLDNIIHKQVNIAYAKEIAKICMKIGFTTHASFVIRFPGETKEDILETIEYAASLNIDSCNFWFATPYPGSDLFDICEKGGYLPKDFSIYSLHKFYHTNFGQPMIETEHFTLEEIKNVREMALQMISQKGKWNDWKYKLYESFNYNPPTKKKN